MEISKGIETPDSAATLLDETHRILTGHIRELQQDCPEDPEGETRAGELLGRYGRAVDHLNQIRKALRETRGPRSGPRRPGAFYHARPAPGGVRIDLRDQEDVREVELLGFTGWNTARNLAYSILRHQAGEDYALMWADRFAENIPQETGSCVISWDQAQSWIETHDWRD